MPPSEYLDEFIAKHKIAAEKVNSLSNDIVNYNMFRINCMEIKDAISSKVRDIVDACVEFMTNYCKNERKNLDIK